jgi:hypothetical protein
MFQGSLEQDEIVGIYRNLEKKIYAVSKENYTFF